MVPTVSRLVRIQKIVRVVVIGKPRFYNTFDYFGNKRKETFRWNGADG